MEPVRFKREKLVLDTSLFVNPEVRIDFGRTPTEALENFLSLAQQLPSLDFYMPSSTFKELLNFIDTDKIPSDLFTVIRQKPPSKYELTCPSLFLYELVEEIRERVNKGLRIAEKAVRGVAKTDEKEIIQGLRRNYREALRDGIIDSKEDIDLILLAKELDALLVSVDNGVILWAEKLGVQWLLPTKLKEYLLTHQKRLQDQKTKAESTI
ncbi:RNA ligase partner protein [bacterium]|nr:MAG: RNA ligase partner protein [bacterium]